MQLAPFRLHYVFFFAHPLPISKKTKTDKLSTSQMKEEKKEEEEENAEQCTCTQQ